MAFLWFLLNLYGVKGTILKTFQVVKAKIFDCLSRFIHFKRCYSLREIAQRYNIPLYYTDKINSKEFLTLVEELSPDLILSSQGHYLGKRLLKIPTYGIINKHAGMLPKYRGVYPVFWAMLNDESEIGVTVHFMNEHMDDGAIILQETLPITEKDTFESLYQRVIDLTPKLFIKAIDAIEEGNITIKPNDKEQATYFTFPEIEDIRRFKQIGKRVI
jgi:methionyl-tRNA formyltransferase